MKKSLLLTCIFLFGFGGPVHAAMEFKADLGPQEKVFFNNNESGPYFPDSSYCTYPHKKKLYGVLPGVRNFRVNTGALAAPITDISEMQGLAGGNTTSLNCNVIVSGGKMYGFYHQEDGGALQTGKPLARIGYAESNDGGKKWTKLGFIITGTYKEHAADPAILVRGDYIYMWYQEAVSDTQPFQAIARAPLSTFGKPGSWSKYYCGANGCGFTEPGLGGQATPINLLAGPFVSYNSYLDRFLAVDKDIYAPGTNRNRVLPLRLKVSSDGIHWEELLPNPPNLPAIPDGYAQRDGSIISLTGSSSASDQNFWLYYTTRNGQSGPWNITLWRQKVELSQVEVPQPTPTPTPIVSPQALPGDLNGDGHINADDITVWLSQGPGSGLDYARIFENYEN